MAISGDHSPDNDPLPGIFRRIDLMAQLLQLNFEVVTQRALSSTTSTRMAVLPSIFDNDLTLVPPKCRLLNSFLPKISFGLSAIPAARALPWNSFAFYACLNKHQRQDANSERVGDVNFLCNSAGITPPRTPRFIHYVSAARGADWVRLVRRQPDGNACRSSLAYRRPRLHERGAAHTAHHYELIAGMRLSLSRRTPAQPTRRNVVPD